MIGKKLAVFLFLGLCVIAFCLAFATVSKADELEIDIYANGADVYPNGGNFIIEVIPDENFKFTLEVPNTFNPADGWNTTESFRYGWTPSSLKSLESDIEWVKNSIKEQESEILSLQYILTHLKDVKFESGADLFLHIDNIEKKTKEVSTKIALIIKFRDELKGKLELMQASLNSKMPDDSNSSQKISGTIDKKTNIKLFTNIIAWQPEYAMNLNEKTGEIDIKLTGFVTQKTGVDISGDIRLYMNHPQQGATAPEATPRVIDSRKNNPPMPMRGVEKSEMYASAPMMDSAVRQFAPPVIDQSLATVSLLTTGFIPGNGERTELLIGRSKVKSEISLLSIPYITSDVFIVAETEKLKQPLFTSQTRFFVDDNFSMTQYINNSLENEQAKLTFGTVPSIKVVRKELIAKKDSNWWGTTGILNDGYTIEVTNSSNTDRIVTVKDRLPMSANTKVEVTNIAIDPKPKDRDDKEILTWEISLKPSETKNLKVSYTVNFPSDEQLLYR